MRIILTAVFAVAAGCAFVQPASAAGFPKAKEKALYSFCARQACEDGASPFVSGALVDMNGMLYGTTTSGGSIPPACNCGSAFALDPGTGVETVLYSFCSRENCTDGEAPYAGLIDVNGTLYGTTAGGGQNGYGTVFAIAPDTGAETVLYSFNPPQDKKDGTIPKAGLIDVKGKLYGTTSQGGDDDWGAVFVLDPRTGAETVLHSFAGGSDGATPTSGLVDVGGTLYGTTSADGGGGGTVFGLDPETGAEAVVYSFCTQENCTDGAAPYGGLINVNGRLYGTTMKGGTSGYGTVFSLDPSNGAEKVLYSFCSQAGCPDGASPAAGLTDVNGTLYGTTQGGGGTACDTGCGTVFSLDPSTGAEKVLTSFCRQGPTCINGQNPAASVIAEKDRLYGTTVYGGAYGYGVVFALKKP